MLNNTNENLITSIQNKANKIITNVTNICDVMKKYDSSAIYDISQFDKVADEMDRILETRGNTCNYNRGFDKTKLNNISFVVPIYEFGETPSIRINLKSSRYFFTTSVGGTFIVDNALFNTSKNFMLPMYNSIDYEVNEEGYKPIICTLYSQDDIEDIRIYSTIPWVAFYSNCPRLTDYSNMQGNMLELRVSEIYNCFNPINLYYNNTDLRKAYVECKSGSLDGMFYGCTDLTTVKLKTELGCYGGLTDMFKGCTSLKHIDFGECQYIPPIIDLSDCPFNANTMKTTCDTLPTNNEENMKTIYFNNKFSMSDALVSLYRMNGYEIIQK